ncbi:MAG: glycosyltransferase family 2 protein [Marinosulfonomonas sp.]|nr:glycosyltransferase family 2 protein [Marinosulfonomonas sp.]
MYKTMLVTTVKDEGPTILEWVAHHRVLGFDTIQVYQNDSTDGTQKSLRTLAKIGAIEYFRNHCGNQQWQNKAYRRASFSESYHKSDWCMALDGDEYLNVKVGDGRVSDLIAACPDADEILVNWRLFGSSGLVDLSDEMITSRFIRAETEKNIRRTRLNGFKSLFKTTAFRRPGIHRAKVPKIENPVVVNGSGLGENDFFIKGWRSFDPNTRALAQVNHYAVRDISSFLIKSAKGSSSHVGRDLKLKYWNLNNCNDEIDTSNFVRSAEVRIEMNRLNDLSNGRLFTLRDRSLEIWRDKLESFSENAALAGLRQNLLAEMSAT